MRLSRQCEIAIDILVYCARSPDELVRTRDAADFANATKGHAHQIVLRLTRLGLLNGVRGNQGGIRLTRRASDIAVGEVIRVMGAAIVPVEVAQHSGAIEGVVKHAARAALDTFDAFTIADLAEQGPGARLECLDCEFRLQVRAQLLAASCQCTRRNGNGSLTSPV